MYINSKRNWRTLSKGQHAYQEKEVTEAAGGVGGPKAGSGAVVRVGGEKERAVGPCLVDVLDDDEWLADGSVPVEEDRDLLVDRLD